MIMLDYYGRPVSFEVDACCIACQSIAELKAFIDVYERDSSNTAPILEDYLCDTAPYLLLYDQNSDIWYHFDEVFERIANINAILTGEKPVVSAHTDIL